MTAKDELSSPINARQIARMLLFTGSSEDLIFEEFLLWPPDLFAFTSQVFSITGAYHMVVSPPKELKNGASASTEKIPSWPPSNEENLKWKADDGWIKHVRRVGFDWRIRLAGYNENGSRKQGLFNEEELNQCKGAQKALTQKARKKEICDRAGRLVKRKNSYKWQEGKWVPKEVGEYWAELYNHMGPEDKDDVTGLLSDWESFKLLMTLHAIVDEACVGWGIRDIPFKKNNKVAEYEYGPDEDALKKVRTKNSLTALKKAESKYGSDKDVSEDDTLEDSVPAKFAAARLKEFGTMATINALRGRVLPKRHTANVGITLRSLTNNLAFHRSSVDVKWRVASETNPFTERLRPSSKNKIFSVLLLPWPRKISALDFKITPNDKRLGMGENLGLFRYSPSDWLNDEELRHTLDSAKKETEEIDMVILPECALSMAEIKRFEKIIGDEDYNVSAYVAGVREDSDNRSNALEKDNVFTDNMVYFKMGEIELGKKERTIYHPQEFELEKNPENIQYKHHRWKVDRFQIENYSLGHALSPYKKWWESIKIRQRKVTFINVGNELTICPLICEDLARQDPIADLIRTVGPSLVITILMDGPQKKERWSARYASVLSEDPGCAVITLTSAGMVDRWNHPYLPPSRIVALWNDGQGSEREIVLEKDAVGILLSLSVSGVKETAADGRTESYATNKVILGGIHQVRLKPSKK